MAKSSCACSARSKKISPISMYVNFSMIGLQDFLTAYKNKLTTSANKAFYLVFEGFIPK